MSAELIIFSFLSYQVIADTHTHSKQLLVTTQTLQVTIQKVDTYLLQLRTHWWVVYKEQEKIWQKEGGEIYDSQEYIEILSRHPLLWVVSCSVLTC